MNQFVGIRFGCPVDFRDSEEASDYERQCRDIRASLPAGAHVVAPRCYALTPRGRSLPAGTAVTEQAFEGGRVPGREVLADLVASGYVLCSEQQTDAERAAIDAHVASVRTLNAARTSESVAAKLDELIATGRFVRAVPAA